MYHLFLTVLVVLLVCLQNGTAAPPSPAPTQALTAPPSALTNQWKEWKGKWKRSYNSTEDNRRFKVWQTNLDSVEKRNAAEGKGKRIHGTTIFSDLTPQEFAATHLTYVAAARGPRAAAHVQSRHLLSTTLGLVDWSNTLTSVVRDQGYCGSCWAFSAVEQVEADAKRTLGLQVVLSPQQLTSCDKSDGGCNGGNPITAYGYLTANAAQTDASDPYTSGFTGVSGICAADPTKGVVKVTGYYQIAGASASAIEANMAQFVQSTGPLSLAVSATAWQTYTGGILTICPLPVNHAVQAVGIDMGNGFWKIRNSWGTAWGESGYIRLAYGADTCAITAQATYTSVAAYTAPTAGPTFLRTSAPTNSKAPTGAPVPATPRPSSPPVAFPTQKPINTLAPSNTKAPITPPAPSVSGVPTVKSKPGNGNGNQRKGGGQ